MKMTVIPVVIDVLGTTPKGLRKEAGRFSNQKTSGDHPDNSIVKISQNSAKSPGDLRRIIVTQTQVKDHQLRQV